ncbi:MAG: hypothetical protein LH649_00915 [Pseudanabaena sp. CAN_BIN31]|nr:hypothetical protein [Pseudanabaena sp. CAN_BIN31]
MLISSNPNYFHNAKQRSPLSNHNQLKARSPIPQTKKPDRIFNTYQIKVRSPFVAIRLNFHQLIYRIHRAILFKTNSNHFLLLKPKLDILY